VQVAKPVRRIVFLMDSVVVRRMSEIKEAVDGIPVAQEDLEEDADPMEQSIRNEIPGIVKEIISDKVLSEIILETAVGEMAAVITTRSVTEMALKVGDRVAALVKATNVSVRRQA
jgi:molybdopterin-binding protein